MFVYTSKKGNKKIYSSPLISKPKEVPGALEAPIYEDSRGSIRRLNINGTKFNIIETKKGFMRSGDLHKNTQHDLILSGEVELWLCYDGVTEKKKIGPNQYIIINPHIPHLFKFLKDTIMIEWWDGPFEAWFYSPYRNIINKEFKKNL